jgi:hypothetical protein
MNYTPVIKSAKARQRFQIGKYRAVLLGDIESACLVEYLYIMAVFDGDSNRPCFFVASEVNRMAKIRGGGSHFLGIFPGEGHENRGASDDWADEIRFTAESLRIIKEKFGIQT